MKSLKYPTLAAAYPNLLHTVLNEGTVHGPRKTRSIEMRGVSMTIMDPRATYIISESRGLNPSFATAELAWILSGSNSAKVIGMFNRAWLAFSDDGETLNGAYGHRLRDSISNIISLLKKDPDSRQAVANIWDNTKDATSKRTKDRPCNTQLQFLRSNTGCLDLIVYVRSQDLIYGLPYDAFNFMTIQRAVAIELGMEVGMYHTVFGSLHVYETNKFWAQKIVEAEDCVPFVAPAGDYTHLRNIARSSIALLIAILDAEDYSESQQERIQHFVDYVEPRMTTQLYGDNHVFFPFWLRALKVLKSAKHLELDEYVSQKSWRAPWSAWVNKSALQEPLGLIRKGEAPQ